MISDLMILEYADKGAQADYEKASMVYKMFEDRKSREMMEKAANVWTEIHKVWQNEVEVKLQVEAEERNKEQAEADAKKQTVTSGRIVPSDEPQKATAEPLDYTVNIEYTSGRKVNFHLDDKDMARHAYDTAKTMAKRLPGIISRIALVQHNTDKSETVLLSADIG